MLQSQQMRGSMQLSHGANNKSAMLACRSLNQTRRILHKTAAVAVDTKQPAAESATESKEKGFKSAIMLQAFGWDSCQKGGWYKQVKAKIGELKNAGITHAWLPPPSQSVAPQGYMPGQLYNLNTSYGSIEELKDLTKSLKEAGIQPIADIVINHRCADQQVNGVWNKFGDDVDHKGRKLDWDRWAITGNDPKFQGRGNPDTGDDYEPAPDLDHLNPDLRAALKDWLKWLHEDIGFSSWRFDYVKGFGAEFITEYVDASVGNEGTLNVGEFWTDMQWGGEGLDYNQDAARQRLVDWIDKNKQRATAFDFPTKGILQEACKNTQYWRLVDPRGKAPGLIGWWPGQAVTFIDNHDTGSTQGHWPFPGELVSVGYAYILTHPGVPCIFWDHVHTWGDGVKNMVYNLIKTRKANKINAESKLKILKAHHDLYIANIDDKLLVKLGPNDNMGDLAPGPEWKLATFGHHFAVWEKK